jgi:tetratricopeptide (TPR) repeat protein
MNGNRMCVFFSIILVFYLTACDPSKDEQLRKDRAESLRKLGEAYMSENKDAAAFRKLKEAEALNPDDPFTHFALGIFYFNKEKYDMAIDHYKKCMELKPDFASVRNNIGLAYLKKGDYDIAISFFKGLTDNYVYATPHYPLFNLGQAYYYKKDYKTAEQYFQKALEAEPEYVIAIHWLGRTELEMGKTSDAIKSLNKAISINASVPEIYFDLGRAFKVLGKKNDALKAFQRVIEIDPEHILAVQAKKEIQKIRYK